MSYALARLNADKVTEALEGSAFSGENSIQVEVMLLALDLFVLVISVTFGGLAFAKRVPLPPLGATLLTAVGFTVFIADVIVIRTPIKHQWNEVE